MERVLQKLLPPKTQIKESLLRDIEMKNFEYHIYSSGDIYTLQKLHLVVEKLKF